PAAIVGSDPDAAKLGKQAWRRARRLARSEVHRRVDQGGLVCGVQDDVRVSDRVTDLDERRSTLLAVRIRARERNLALYPSPALTVAIKAHGARVRESVPVRGLPGSLGDSNSAERRGNDWRHGQRADERLLGVGGRRKRAEHDSGGEGKASCP